MLCEVASYLEPECSGFGEAERDFFASVSSPLFPDRISMNFLVKARRSFTLTTVPSRIFQPTLSSWMLKETPAISSIPPLGSSRNASSTRPRAVERVSPVLVRRNQTTHAFVLPDLTSLLYRRKLLHPPLNPFSCVQWMLRSKPSDFLKRSSS